MKKLLIICLTLLALSTMLLLTSCSAIFNTTKLGDVVNKTYDFKDFTNVQISNSFHYDLEQSDTYSVNVSTYSSLVDRLDIHQSGNTLFVSMKNNTVFGFNFSNGDYPSVTITLPQISKLAVSGSCRGTAAGFKSTNDLEVDLSASSSANLDVTAGKTNMNISGSSNISGNLTAGDTSIIVSSSSRLDMDLLTGKTSLTFSSSSSGAGSLTAADTTTNVTGSSNINIAMKTGNAVFSASGSSYINGSLTALNSDFTLSSSSHSNLQGTAGHATIVASSSSYINFTGLILQSADVTLQSSSHGSIYTDGALSIDLNGSSRLDYYGNPAIGKTNISGSSELNHK
jgi:hypothetical protein